MKGIKLVKVTEEIHKRLKQEALDKNITLFELLTRILKRHFGILILILTVSACSSTKMYTKVDRVNPERYEHQQKIELGLSMRQVVSRFGSPQEVKRNYVNQRVIEFVYYRNIACSSVFCFVRFDEEEKRVVSHDNFRQEYTNYLQLD